MIFISIHALLTESDCVACCIISDRPNISIHALLTESDLFYCFFALCYVISIHALLTESDSVTEWTATWNLSFLSTLSLRRATVPNRHPYHCNRNFYPRSPYGERREVIAVMTEAQSISIHALLTESDLLVILSPTHRKLFLSTLSLRRAT